MNLFDAAHQEAPPEGRREAARDGSDALALAWAAGTSHELLRGKHIALLCGEKPSPDAGLISEAIAALGGRTAFLSSKGWHLEIPDESRRTGRLLGRLYDGVICQGLPAAVLGELAAACDIPIRDADLLALARASGDAPEPPDESGLQWQAKVWLALSAT